MNTSFSKALLCECRKALGSNFRLFKIQKIRIAQLKNPNSILIERQMSVITDMKTNVRISYLTFVRFRELEINRICFKIKRKTITLLSNKKTCQAKMVG